MKIREFTYRKVASEMKEISRGKALKFSSPKKNTSRPNPKSNLNQGELEHIKSIIHNFYIIKKRVPTLKGIHNKILQSGIDFKGELSTLGKIIEKLGFRWCITIDKRKVLMESYDIRLKRIQYLGLLRQCIQDRRPIIFTDEFYINSCHTNPKIGPIILLWVLKTQLPKVHVLSWYMPDLKVLLIMHYLCSNQGPDYYHNCSLKLSPINYRKYIR